MANSHWLTGRRIITIHCKECGMPFDVINTSVAARDVLCINCYIQSVPQPPQTRNPAPAQTRQDYKRRAAGDQ